MVVLGNTADALVNGYIFLADLVPDCLCSDLLEVVRRKFCCEFVPDEVARTVRMELFGDATEAAPIALDSYVAENPEIVYGDPRQLKLYSKEVLGSTVDFGGERDVKSRFPTAYIDNASEYGYQYVRDGYKAHRSGVIKQVLADMRLPYYSADPGFEDYEVEVPDIQWSMETVTLTWINSNGNTGGDKVEGAYIGEANWLNSKLVTFGSEEVTDTEKERTEELENHKAGVLLALIYVHDNLLNRAVYRTSASGYTLGYNGDKGIYETFYRNFDTLLRNALHTVTVPLLLTDEMKQTMSMTSRVQIGNRDYLINKLNYVVGDSAAPNPTELLTANPQHPIGYGLGTRDIFPERKYTWRREYRVTELTESEWIAAGYDKETVVTSLTTYLPSTPPMSRWKQVDDTTNMTNIYHTHL